MAYISREKAIEIVKSGGYWEREDMEVAVACIEQTPTAEVVEVVRCKDCKHNTFEEANGTVHCCIDEFVRDRRKPEDFCSRGERRNKE